MHDGVKTYETSFPNYWCYVQYSADILLFAIFQLCYFPDEYWNVFRLQRWKSDHFWGTIGNFKREIDFRFLNVNPDDRICFGVQKSLLPSTQVQYTEYGNDVSHIQKFWVLNSEDSDFTGFIDQLKNHVPKYEQFDPVEFNLLSMLDLRNLYFFGCVFLTLTACNFIWFCIHDEKKPC